MRGIVRNEAYDGGYNCYVYSKRQAEALKVKLDRIAQSVELIALDDAGIMNETLKKPKVQSAIKVPKTAKWVPGAKGKGDRLEKSAARQRQREKTRKTVK